MPQTFRFLGSALARDGRTRLVRRFDVSFHLLSNSKKRTLVLACGSAFPCNGREVSIDCVRLFGAKRPVAASASVVVAEVGQMRFIRSTTERGEEDDNPIASRTDGKEGTTRDNGVDKGNESISQTSPPTLLAFLIHRLPPYLQPYARLARLDKPIGTMLLLWPCCWSTALAAPLGSAPDLGLLALFAAGSFIMRGAGCTINDMWDADYDKSVARTKTRPLANGELSHVDALGFLAAQLTAGLGVLLSLPNTWYCFQLGAASLPLVFAYPLMKRYTNWPQLVLGMTFNWGAFMGWAATHGSLDVGVVGPLYCSGIAWTLVYDTLYAHQDKADDSKLGLKSTALHFGERTKPILHGFAALALTNWSLAGYVVGYDSLMFYGGCGLAWAHLAWQIHTANLDGPSNLAERFRSNNHVGAIVFVSCVAGSLTAAT